MAKQQQLWHEIQTNRRVAQQVAVARAEALKKIEEEGHAIKQARGNRAQWHANFKLDEFDGPIGAARELCVIQEDIGTGARELRGLLVLGRGHSLAD
eukprot:1610004-Prymnesium_polylepis.1